MSFAVIRLSFCALLLLLVSKLDSQTTTAQGGTTTGGGHGSSNHGSWKVIHEENFEDHGALFKTGSPPWVSDTYQNTDEFSDGGGYFKRLGVKPPMAFRAEGPIGKDGWLSVAAYSRSNLTKFSDLFEVVPDPADPNNHVLKVSSPSIRMGLLFVQRMHCRRSIGFA